MGCNCGKGGSSSTIAEQARAAARARAGTTVQPGFDQDTPLLIGASDAEPTPARRVRMLSTVGNLTVGKAIWVTGDGVDSLIADGSALDITTTQQRQRVFSVGGMPYTDLQRANRVSAATGQPVIEVA